MHHRKISFFASLLLVCALAGTARAASPRLDRILPGGIERGNVGKLVFEGERLTGTEEILFYDRGFEVLQLDETDSSVTATVRVAKETRLGEHIAHLRTKSGVTEFRAFYVEPLPHLEEIEPNNTVATAQLIASGVTASGRVTADDEDLFALDAKEGEQLVVEVVAMRLGNTMFDPYLAILDSEGNEIASSTGHPFSLQDGIMSVTVPRDGRYYISIREVDRGGNDMSYYRLHIGNFPRPIAIFPPGGKMGQSLSVTFLGDPAGTYSQTVSLPDTFDRTFALSGETDRGAAPTPIPFRLSEHENAFESEPNDRSADATSVALQDAFCGIIQRPGDRDCYRFEAKAGDHYDVEVYARRVRSALDAVMELYDPSGKMILSNDDGAKVTENQDAEERAPDSYFRFKVPADGEYTLRIYDRLARGGPAFVYRVELSAVQPWMLVRLPRVQDPNDLWGQYRQQVFVAKDNHFACLVRTRTKDFSGPMSLEIPELPDGVTMETMTIPAGTDAFPVVFHASEDAPLSGKLLSMRGAHADPTKNISGDYYTVADLLRGKPGLARLKTKIAHRFAIAVTEKIPFRLELDPPTTPLVRDGKIDLTVRVIREKGFDREVMLVMPFLPPGVYTSANQKVLPDADEAVFTLTAHPQITPRDWKLYVLGSAGEKNDLFWASTPLVPLRVDKQFVKADLSAAAGEPGQDIPLNCQLKGVAPFAGRATARLIGLPDGTSAQEVPFDADTEKLSFLIKTRSDTPIGEYPALACEVEVPSPGGAVVATAGKGLLVVEASEGPTVAKKVEATAAPADAASRLEQLRKEAGERQTAQASAAGEGGDE